jgi:hypothetical protein
MSRRAILVLLTGAVSICSSLLLPAHPCLSQYAFEPSVRLEPDSVHQQASSIAADDYGNIGVVWVTDNGRADVRFAKSTDGGETFLPSVLVDTTLYPLLPPRAAFDGDGNPHVAWTEFELAYGKTQAKYARSTDGGASFLPGFYVAPDSTMSQHTHNLALDSSGNPMVVWNAFVNPDQSLYFSRSYDGGCTFEAPVRIDPHPGYQGGPDVALDDSDNVYISYSGDYWACFNYVFLVKSTDGGQTFGERVWVDRDTSCNFTTSIGIVPPEGGPLDNVVMVVWNESKPPAYDPRVYFAKSTDGGNIFGDVVTVSYGAAGNSFPLLGIGELGNLIAVWARGPLRYSCSLDGGLTFSSEASVDSLRTDTDNFPSLAMAAGGVPMVVRTGGGPGHSPDWQVYFNKGKKVGVQELPFGLIRDQEFHFGRPWPNPFEGVTRITYSVPGGVHVSLKVYDLSGRLVRALVDEQTPGSSGSVAWDGTDSSGRRVRDGVYFCKLRSGEFSATRKMVLLR